MKELNKKTAVIGAGPMGLMCAYELLKKGYEVTLFERDDRIGGMSASFDLDGTRIERYYHFICTTDQTLFDVLKELKIDNHLVWRNTRMGFYFDGKLYPWGDPFSLLRFPKLNLISKIRYGLNVLYSKKIKNWHMLDKENAINWLKKWLGKQAYQVLWHKLFELKFFEYQDQLSAAWIASRIQRVAKSRQSIFKEKLGYLRGGSDMLLSAMEKAIISLGGKIVLNADVQQVVADSGKVTGVSVNGQFEAFDAVISTIPMPYIPRMVPALPDAVKEQIASIKNVGVACVIMKLKQNYSDYFWMNVNHEGIDVPGLIEYSNLNPEAGNILYVPYYMPQTHPKYKYTDEEFMSEVCHYLKSINPEFSSDWIISSKVSRYGFAQTVCSPEFFAKIPAMKTDLDGFYMADTAFYYPEDRGISESFRIGKELAALMAYA